MKKKPVVTMIPNGENIEKTYKFGDALSPVAVATLASDYEKFDLKGYAILGSCYTENFGVQMAIADMLKNPNIAFLILCGRESAHLSGHAFKALHENGVVQIGTSRRIVGCKSPLPFIDEIPVRAVDEYQENITLIDMIGVEDAALIQAKIDECVAASKSRTHVREPYDAHMPEIGFYSWKKYSAIVESDMKNRLCKK
jgi:tetrahydromethanopterin S-methyltransferase subunit A